MIKVEILREYFDKTLEMRQMKKGEMFIYEDDARALDLVEKGYVKVIAKADEKAKVVTNKKSKRDG